MTWQARYPLKALALSLLLAASSGTWALGNDDSIWVGTFGSNSLNGWRAVDRDALIVWASPSRPYLVRIAQPHVGLRFANNIGFSQTVGRITKFDDLYVRGYRVPIRSIQRLDPQVAKAMRYQRRG